MHAANHPGTKHYCEDVWKVDPREACRGRRPALAWFSPDCKHFSKAKGGKPVDKNIRGLAWLVILWAKTVKPRVIMLENVEEFEDWGPLGEDNRPDPLRIGLTFRIWKGKLKALGYKVEHRCSCARTTARRRRASASSSWRAATGCRSCGRGVRRARAHRLPRRRRPDPVGAADVLDLPHERGGQAVRREAAARRQHDAPRLSRLREVRRERPAAVHRRRRARRRMLARPGTRSGSTSRCAPSPASTTRHAICTPLITEHANASNPRSWRADEPLRTQCAGEGRALRARRAVHGAALRRGPEPGAPRRARPGAARALGRAADADHRAVAERRAARRRLPREAQRRARGDRAGSLGEGVHTSSRARTRRSSPRRS
jgi:DNA (cytosine-5)-methyltransferase 1